MNYKELLIEDILDHSSDWTREELEEKTVDTLEIIAWHVCK